jgi:hypothetical protein
MRAALEDPFFDWTCSFQRHFRDQQPAARKFEIRFGAAAGLRAATPNLLRLEIHT